MGNPTKLPGTGLNVGSYVTMDADGYLYQRGVKITKTAAQINEMLQFPIGTHDYDNDDEDWTLSAAELLKTVHKPTNASGAVNAIIADTAGIPYVFINGTGQALTVKTKNGTGVAITAGKTAIVMSDGTNVIALAAESK